MLEDSKAQLSLTLYYTTFNNDATIASYSKLDNNSNQEVVIHKDFLLWLIFQLQITK